MANFLKFIRITRLSVAIRLSFFVREFNEHSFIQSIGVIRLVQEVLKFVNYANPTIPYFVLSPKRRGIEFMKQLPKLFNTWTHKFYGALNRLLTQTA